MAKKKGKGAAVGSRCRHYFPRSSCPVCRGEAVYVTRGGQAFHRDRRCSALAAGQQKVAERGHSPDPIQEVRKKSAMLDYRLPCRVCFPEAFKAIRPKSSARAKKAAGGGVTVRGVAVRPAAPKVSHRAGAVEYLPDGVTLGCSCGYLAKGSSRREVQTLIEGHLRSV